MSISTFFDEYLNIKKMVQSKREYREQMARVEELPHEYRYVFKKIQERMWMFAAGAGYDMMKIHADLLELFESGAADGKRVLVKIHGDDDVVTVSVTNYGYVIPPDELPLIFNKFYRVEQSRSSSTGGTGLGLAIVRQVMEEHKGTIAIDTAPGRGTTMLLRFPTITPPEEDT